MDKVVDLCKNCKYGKYVPSVIMKACVFSCQQESCIKIKEGQERKKNDKG